ncbi:MAG: hypothetical protein AAFY09_10750, partial [Pseudomonadota bacterium]
MITKSAFWVRQQLCSATAAAALAIGLGGAAFAPMDDADALETGLIGSFEKDVGVLTEHQRFARDQLVATIKLYDDHMRVEATGQYLDRVELSKLDQTSHVSSIASTGVGLMSLIIGDQLGVIDDAAEKARFTLANLLNADADAMFQTPRSKSGWYKHFI